MDFLDTSRNRKPNDDFTLLGFRAWGLEGLWHDMVHGGTAADPASSSQPGILRPVVQIPQHGNGTVTINPHRVVIRSLSLSLLPQLVRGDGNPPSLVGRLSWLWGGAYMFVHPPPKPKHPSYCNIQSLTIRIGFWGPLYHRYEKEPSKYSW